MRSLVTLSLYVALLLVAVSAVSAQEFEVTVVTATPPAEVTADPTAEAGNGTIVEDTGDTTITLELPSNPPVDDEGILDGANGIWALVTVVFGVIVWLQSRNTNRLVQSIDGLNTRTLSSFERMYGSADATTKQAIDTVHSIFELAAQMNIPALDPVLDAVDRQFDEVTDDVPVASKRLVRSPLTAEYPGRRKRSLVDDQ